MNKLKSVSKAEAESRRMGTTLHRVSQGTSEVTEHPWGCVRSEACFGWGRGERRRLGRGACHVPAVASSRLPL